MENQRRANETVRPHEGLLQTLAEAAPCYPMTRMHAHIHEGTARTCAGAHTRTTTHTTKHSHRHRDLHTQAQAPTHIHTPGPPWAVT